MSTTTSGSTPGESATPTPDRAAPALPPTMRAATRRAYGGTEQVRVEQVDRPEPGEGEVLLRVGAAGVDRGALHLLTGTPYLARLAFGPRHPRRATFGLEVAGEVVAVGPGVTQPAVGDRVLGTAWGSFAEYVVARADALAPTPEGLDDVQAATLPVSAGTAVEAVERVAAVTAGQRVLVIGASGGVGLFAVQLAAHVGAEVTAVCSDAKADLVRGVGAHHVADYRTTSLEDLTRRHGPFDAVVDIAGNRPLRSLRAALTPTGTLVLVGGEHGGRVLGGLHRNLGASALDPLTRQRLRWFVTRQTAALHARVADLAATGGLQPVVDRVVGLDGVAGALAAMEAGTLRGKVVVRP